jgi:hypothetical protein
MNTTIRRSITIALSAFLIGCVSTGTQSGSSRGSGTTLTREQLSTTNADNLYDAINKLRPNWLTSRGPTSVTDATPTSVDVFMGNNYLGKADYLHQVRPGDVTEVAYFDPGSAAARFGMGHPRGVIELIRK